MVGTGLVAGGEGRFIGAVVVLSGDERPVDVAIDKIDEDLGVGAGQKMGAPVGTGEPFGDADPGAGLIVTAGITALAGGALFGAGIGEAAGIGRGTALPVELNLDAVIAFGGEWLVGEADDEGDLGPNGRFGQGFGDKWQVGGLDEEAVAIGAGLDVGVGEQMGGHGAKIVGALVVDRDDGKAVVGRRMGGVLLEGDDGALGELADGAVGGEAAVGGFVGGEGEVGAQAGGIGILEAIGAAGIVDFETGQVFGGEGTVGLGGGGGQGLVVPAGQREEIGAGVMGFTPDLDGVGGLGGVAAVKAQGGLPAGGQFGLAVEKNPLVTGMGSAVAGAGRLVVFEAEGKAFVGK